MGIVVGIYFVAMAYNMYQVYKIMEVEEGIPDIEWY